MQLRFHTLDVFTKTRFGGNPLAVVHDADGLDGAQMQTIAAEFNLSETVFLLKAARDAHSAKARIFTPKSELVFAGHPTIGTAALLAVEKMRAFSGGQDALVTLELGIGLVRVGVKVGATGDAAYAEFDAPKTPERISDVPSVETIAAAIGLIPGEIGFSNHRPSVFDAGNQFLFVPVNSRAALAKARASAVHWRQLADGLGAYLYSAEPEHVGSHYRARMFAPLHGVAEDPATGSAAAAFAGVIQHFDRLPAGNHRRRIEQGYEMGRPSEIDLSIEVVNGGLERVRIGGYAVAVSEGRLTV
jgi:trans-2,3-dihydro-3-hydroxyanthranilate isomerase